jgi:hypothetical protein
MLSGSMNRGINQSRCFSTTAISQSGKNDFTSKIGTSLSTTRLISRLPNLCISHPFRWLGCFSAKRLTSPPRTGEPDAQNQRS